MAKGDDALAKKKNKAIRKRNRRAGAGTTEAIEGVQSHKRRRKSGTRRVCEVFVNTSNGFVVINQVVASLYMELAMCYTLPTPEDPFNDKRKHKKDRSTFMVGDSAEVNADGTMDGQPASSSKQSTEENGKKPRSGKSNGAVVTESGKDSTIGLSKGKFNSANGGKHREAGSTIKSIKRIVWNASIGGATPLGPKSKKGEKFTKFDHSFQLALSTIYDTKDSQPGLDVSEFAQQWWQACSQGLGALGVCCDNSCIQAYVVAAVPHITANRDLHGGVQGPVALFLVKSKDRAMSVRQICKPLKNAMNIHSVSLHSETLMQHQVDGLAMQMPEAVVATPDRLCSLLAANALSLASVSYVILDGLDDLISGGFAEQLYIIKKQLQPDIQVGVLSATFLEEVVNATKQWLQDPIHRAVSDSLPQTLSACITQTVSVVTTVESKLAKFDKILQQVHKKREEKQNGIVLLMLNSSDQISTLAGLLDKHGFFPQVVGNPIPASRKERHVIWIAKFDQVMETEFLARVEIVINYDLSWPVHYYKQLIMGIARKTLHAKVETLCSGAAAMQANELVELLHSCWQRVPRPLLLLAQAASLLQK